MINSSFSYPCNEFLSKGKTLCAHPQAVSYTHLDVYKRQGSANRNASRSYTKIAVIQKHMSSESGDESVPSIIELFQNKVRSLVKVSRPKTFEKLQYIIRQLHRRGPSC